MENVSAPGPKWPHILIPLAVLVVLVLGFYVVYGMGNYVWPFEFPAGYESDPNEPTTLPTSTLDANTTGDECALIENLFDAEKCYWAKGKVGNEDIEKIYSELLLKLTPARKQALQESQRTWLAYRNAQCEFVSLEYEGGTAASLSWAVCLSDLNLKRLQALTNFSQGPGVY